MNCKPGDLAVIVAHTLSRNNGIFVTVGPAWTGGKHRGIPYKNDRPAWVCTVVGRRPMLCEGFGKEFLAWDRPVADECLRPIRDQPGADETLTWAGLPAEARRRETEWAPA